MIINIKKITKKYKLIVLILLITHINTYADTTNSDHVIRSIFYEVNDEAALYPILYKNVQDDLLKIGYVRGTDLMLYFKGKGIENEYFIKLMSANILEKKYFIVDEVLQSIIKESISFNECGEIFDMDKNALIDFYTRKNEQGDIKIHDIDNFSCYLYQSLKHEIILVVLYGTDGVTLGMLREHKLNIDPNTNQLIEH